jgi:FkbM family methyltransferase
MKTIYKALKPLFLLLPRSPYIYKQCRHYCNTYLGENEGDMRYNGELHFVNGQLADCETVFDVGANEGNWTIQVLKLKPKLNIHCFEPGPSYFSQLQERLQLPNVNLVRKGLSSTEEKDIPIHGISLHENYGVDPVRGRTPSVQTVSLTTLSAYMQSRQIEQVDLMKVDVEGHELRVFEGGMKQFQMGRIRRVYFEYHGTFIKSSIFLRDIFRLFEGLDYRFYKLMPDHLQRVEVYDCRLENFQFKHFAIMHTSVREPPDVRPLDLGIE